MLLNSFLIERLLFSDVEKKGLVERVKRLEQEEAAASARERAIEEKYIREMERAEEMYRAQFKRCEDLEVLDIL